MSWLHVQIQVAVSIALFSLLLPSAADEGDGVGTARADISWRFPSLRDVTLRKFNALLEAKVLPTLNRELPEAMREGGQDPMPSLGSTSGALVIRNVRGLSSIRFTSLEAKSLWPFKAELEMSAEMAVDLTAEGEVSPPESLSRLIHSLAQKAGASDEAARAPTSLPFTIRFTGVHMPHGVAYVLSNNLTAVSGIEVVETPVVYEELSVQCHPGLGTEMSPARALCTKAASKMARLKKEYIQQHISQAVKKVVQGQIDEMLPDRLPHDRYDLLAARASDALLASVVVLCGLAIGTLAKRIWHRRLRRSASAATVVPEAKLLESEDPEAPGTMPPKVDAAADNAHFEHGAE